jgi:3-hydroxyisobutyrate dehydrogenase-like beta-hydroxyacid dehydrogenase
MLGVVIENLIEITLLANKMGVSRHAFLSFMNNGVMGSMFTAYKTPALVNLDWKTTFTLHPGFLEKIWISVLNSHASGMSQCPLPPLRAK